MVKFRLVSDSLLFLEGENLICEPVNQNLFFLVLFMKSYLKLRRYIILNLKTLRRETESVLYE